jgi:hypothetical protein
MISGQTLRVSPEGVTQRSKKRMPGSGFSSRQVEIHRRYEIAPLFEMPAIQAQPI